MNLGELPKSCFQGVIPTVITTCDAAGVPNVTYLSQVFFLDDGHVALSCQFFNKTKQNVLANPYANIELYEPQTFEGYRLDLRFDHAETSGPLFERMSARIEAIASHTGMKGIFKLISADIYDVIGVETIPGLLRPPAHDTTLDEPFVQYKTELAGLQMVSQRICRATDLDGLFAAVLEALDVAIGFEHSMVLLLDEGGTRLYAIASRGYGQAEVGAEVGLGEGQRPSCPRCASPGARDPPTGFGGCAKPDGPAADPGRSPGGRHRRGKPVPLGVRGMARSLPGDHREPSRRGHRHPGAAQPRQRGQRGARDFHATAARACLRGGLRWKADPLDPLLPIG